MITFITLFLGLTAGKQRISLTADRAVKAVEVQIDGRSLGILFAPPWEVTADFGTGLEPHRIVARALDGSGAELGRTTQFVNVPRAAAEGEIFLERGSDGQPVAARVTWESVTRATPRRIEVDFDGRRLSVKDPSRFGLPRYDRKRIHMLVVEMEFSAFEKVRLERAFGAGIAESATRELTAIPIAVAKGKPDAKSLSAALSAGGEPIRVAARRVRAGEGHVRAFGEGRRVVRSLEREIGTPVIGAGNAESAGPFCGEPIRREGTGKVRHGARQ
jgi:hypothetical protein